MMATIIRPEISKNNRYWICKHRHYELKHFCLQYPLWKEEYAALDNPSIRSATTEFQPSSNIPSDPTGSIVLRKDYYLERINLIEKIAKEADKYLYEYIIKAVTEDRSFTYLKAKLGIPCGRDMYYDRYRKFFWLLSNYRN